MDAAIELGKGSLIDCSIDRYIDAIKDDGQDDDFSFWTLYCDLTASGGASLAANQAASNYMECMGSISDICSLDCPDD